MKTNKLWSIMLMLVMAILVITFISCGGNEEDDAPSVLTPSVKAEAVDLGLSVKWASMNVGATKPEGSGDYFAWGETTPQSDRKYNWTSYKWCNGTLDTMTKYCTKSQSGKVDNKTTLELSDDVAHANWGGSWRMPTPAEMEELRTKCTWTVITIGNMEGYKITGRNGNSIILPATGRFAVSALLRMGTLGYYWSSSLCSDPINSYALFINPSSKIIGLSEQPRGVGMNVRAVCP